MSILCEKRTRSLRSSELIKVISSIYRLCSYILFTTSPYVICKFLTLRPPPLPDVTLLTLTRPTDNPVGHFPTYEPTLEKQEAIAAAFAEARKDPLQHYDASKEYRARGAGFYQFATGDEEARQKQMEELKNARLDTMGKREELGVEDGVGGEGAAAGGGKKTNVNRAVEKRKREIEERRKLIEAKKRKVVNEKAEAAGNLKDAAAASTPPSGSKAT